MTREERINLLKYMVAGAIGFGLGGLIWGLSIPTTVHHAVPFTYTAGALALGSLGGVSLALFSKDWRRIVKFALFGSVGFLIGFIIGVIMDYPLFLVGSGFVRMFFPDKFIILYFCLKPSLWVGESVFVFAVVGAIGGLFFGLATRKRILASAVAGMLGFGIGSLIAPVIGNLVGMASGSLLAAYVTTFMIIGMILGAFLGRCVYLAEHQPACSAEKR